ncbi:MAG TPA: phosphoserine phosphatase SerB [Acidocella sp.]|nr:phosphoserine phosphatase SerB [Acidocella sp.]
MSYIVTLVANRQAGSLSQADATRALEFCAGMHPNWLSPGHAVEFTVQAVPDRAALQAALEHKAVDVFTAKFRGRRKAVLVADMDSTIVTCETLDELAAFAGLKDEIAEITRRAMNGELDFAAALRERVAMLKGLKLSALEATWAEIQFCPGARELVATMRAHGATTALVSGGFTFFTSRVAAEIGFDIHRSNELLDNGSELTGAVAEPILDKNAKLTTLRELAEKRGVKLAATLAVGDGANDLPMLKEAGLGIAYHAKPVVAAQVANRVEHTDLTSLLFAQGYPASAFKTGE